MAALQDNSYRFWDEGKKSTTICGSKSVDRFWSLCFNPKKNLDEELEFIDEDDCEDDEMGQENSLPIVKENTLVSSLEKLIRALFDDSVARSAFALPKRSL